MSFLQVVSFICILIGICYFLYKIALLQLKGKLAIILPALLIVKLCFAIAINAYYTDRYQNQQFSDIHKFFYDAVSLKRIASQSPLTYFKLMVGIDSQGSNQVKAVQQLKNWQNHTDEYLKTIDYQDSNYFNSQRTIIKINSIIAFASFNFLPTHSLIFSFAALFGMWLLALRFRLFQLKKGWLLFVFLALLPTVLIWTSTIHKEALILFCIGTITYFIGKTELNYRSLLIAISAGILLLLISTHALITLILAGILTFLYKKGKIAIMLGIAASVSILIFCVKCTNFNPLELISSKFNQQNKIGRGGYYFENKALPYLYFVDETDFEKVQPKTKSPKAPRIFYLPANTNVFVYREGKIENKQLLGEFQGWYYMKLHYVRANTYLPSEHLNSSISAFLLFSPNAIEHVFLPLSLEKIDGKQVFFLLETLILIALIGWGVYRNAHHFSLQNSETFVLIFSLIYLLLIAYTTPILGNIVRYKSPVILILFLVIGSRILRTFDPQ